MLELIAQGANFDSRWRRLLPERVIEIGRATPAYRVPWDAQVSRRHVILTPEGNGIRVERIEEASNPVFYEGEKRDSFLLKPGEHFVIGKTSFSLSADKAFVSLAPNPISQRTFSHEFLQKIPYRNADRRIEVLNRLPEIISTASNVDDLLVSMVNTLMEGIPASSTIGIVQLQEVGSEEDSETTDSSILVVKWDRRGLKSGDFQPSEKLIRQAIEANETTLHVWNQRKRAKQSGSKTEYTFDYENDWAFVCPIDGQASKGWGIYVAGANLAGGSSLDTGSGEADLQDDVKFCEVAGTTLKNLLLVKQLERQQSSLRTFFSPVVMEAISARDPEEVLAPRKCDVSVLFCDLRGFSRKSEEMADKLLLLLKRVSDSLGIMTHKILESGGVIGDFHGDSAMGFWGWPIEPTDRDHNAQVAVTAALDIQAAVVAQLASNPKLENFQVGLGIASGPAVAGKIGTRDQVKVTVFGPVVNLASRMEGFSKWFGSCVLTDGETVKRIQAAGTKLMTRRLGRFQPFGLENSVDVFQVGAENSVDVKSLKGYQLALAAFESGEWSKSEKLLGELSDQDVTNRFLASYISQHGDKDRNPPDDFTGVIRMQAK